MHSADIMKSLGRPKVYIIKTLIFQAMHWQQHKCFGQVVLFSIKQQQQQPMRSFAFLTSGEIAQWMRRAFVWRKLNDSASCKSPCFISSCPSSWSKTIALNLSIVHVQNARNFWAQAAMGIPSKKEDYFPESCNPNPYLLSQTMILMHCTDSVKDTEV